MTKSLPYYLYLLRNLDETRDFLPQPTTPPPLDTVHSSTVWRGQALQTGVIDTDHCPVSAIIYISIVVCCVHTAS